mmetsp:Transcript_61913/g.72385  ORF Transcript_61913/g.72385 Transcript_61913/m.72385 type:complete len:726 (+) Transcript_61913:164-2341(+)
MIKANLGPRSRKALSRKLMQSLLISVSIVLHFCSQPIAAGRRTGDSINASNLMHNTNKKGGSIPSDVPIRVAYQGEPGAYSEKSTRELLGANVIAVGYPNFEACYRAVTAMECDYACVPVENSLGGSIHENYDLMLRYDLTIVAEHDFRVRHCFLVKPGMKREDVKYAISHSQALAQCDGYLRGLGITPVPTYDTAGSAKMIANTFNGVTDGARALPGKCTPENTAAIASDLAGEIFGLDSLDKGIEDDDSNFTRFLLLGRKGVVEHLTKKISSKTSVVFTLPDSAGALYKALACFSLRDIDFSKIESRPTSASLLHFLKFRSQIGGRTALSRSKSPRFRYCFYLDFLASELDESAQNALHHLREQADFCRVLGSYPEKSKLVGPVLAASERLKSVTDTSRDQLSVHGDEETSGSKLKIGIIGFGEFGLFLAKKLVTTNAVSCIDPVDKVREASKIGVKYYATYDMVQFLQELDVVIISVPMIEFEEIVSSLPKSCLHGKLIVEVCPMSSHPKSILMKYLPPDADIICSNPMFGPTSSSSSWDGLPFVYEKARVADNRRAEQFLSIFSNARCKMVELSAEQHDSSTADAEFITHLTGRLLDCDLLPPTPVTSKEYAALLDVADMTSADTFDLFYGMYKYNKNSKKYLNKMRENLALLERQLAAKEAYIAAKSEMQSNERQRLIAECRSLLQEVSKSSALHTPKEQLQPPDETKLIQPIVTEQLLK